MINKPDTVASGEAVTPAVGTDKRSNEAPERVVAVDPEVLAKPKRRQFSAAYRLRILEEADGCRSSGEIGRLLRREGLYSSHLSTWRKARRDGVLAGLTPNKRGAKAKKRNPLEPKVRALESEVARLQDELSKAHTILEVQGKVAGLLGINLKNGQNS
jgi:transposase-like protein